MSSFILIVCFASLLQSVRSQIEPKISNISYEQIKNVGGTVSLNCTVSNASPFKVVWMKTPIDPLKAKNSVPISSNENLIVKNPRISLHHNIDRQSSSFSLQIKNIQVNDVGAYQCMILVEEPQDPITATVNLQVRQPPVISENSTKSIRIPEGQSARLECLASGYPPPKISWKREPDAPLLGLTNNESVYRFSSMKKSDRGTYYCVAENGVGNNATRKMNVEVEFAPVVKTVQPRIGQSPKYDIDLECRVEADPSPEITWFKDRKQIVHNEHYRITQIAKAAEYPEYTDSTVRVLSIEKHQYGRYECHAKNKLGNATDSIELFETSEPNQNFRGVLYGSAPTNCSCCHLIILFLFAGLLLKLVSFF